MTKPDFYQRSLFKTENPVTSFNYCFERFNCGMSVVDQLKEKNCEVVIPSKSNRVEPRDYARHLYKARHLIENFFAKLKQYRAIATRYDETAVNFLGSIYLASSVVWLN